MENIYSSRKFKKIENEIVNHLNAQTQNGYLSVGKEGGRTRDVQK